MEFVLATKDDISSIMNLYREAMTVEGCTWDEGYPNLEILTEDVECNRQYCMKDDNGEVLAAISVDSDPIVDALDCWHENCLPGSELARLVVSKSAMNKGIARMMLTKGMEELVNRGFVGIHFLVSPNNKRAVNSYAKLNFNNVGETDLFGEHWWCYEKQL